jgi:lipopolysaccharide export system permease protein
LGVLVSFGRLYADHEMTVLYGLGVSPQRIFRVVFLLSMGIALILAAFTLYINPELHLFKERYLAKKTSEAWVEGLTAQRFHLGNHGRQVFYAEGLNEADHQLDKVFILEAPDRSSLVPQEVVTANKGEIQTLASGQRFLILESGQRYEGIPGALNYVVTRFQKYTQALQFKVQDIVPLRRTTSTVQLWRSPQLGDTAELEWRLSTPLCVIVLGCLAFPLSRVGPRQGHYARVFPAIVIFIVYLNFLSISRRWIETSAVPPWLGVWWVHGLFLLLATWLFMRRGSFFRGGA